MNKIVLSLIAGAAVLSVNTLAIACNTKEETNTTATAPVAVDTTAQKAPIVDATAQKASTADATAKAPEAKKAQ